MNTRVVYNFLGVTEHNHCGDSSRNLDLFQALGLEGFREFRVWGQL